MLERQLSTICFDEKFGRQMRFIVGPRQTGKTFFSREFLKLTGCEKLYYNWDKRDIRTAYKKETHFFAKDLYEIKGTGKPWVCFDEIHKIPKWKNILKDFFDSFEDRCRFIVTGSARLDLLKYTGESLLGRYFTFRLFPLRLIEVIGKIGLTEKISPNALEFVEKCISDKKNTASDFEHLLIQGGFPEPFLSDSDEFIKRWRTDYCDNFIKEDLRDLTHISEIENVLQMIEFLPSRVGNPLSLNSIREDMEVSHTAVRNWLRVLKLTYVIFLLKPYSKKIARSIKKESKCYFFDWGKVEEPSAKFENYVAVELKALVSMLTESGLGEYDLYYVRMKDGKESDFLITFNKNPWLLLEAKLSETGIASHHIQQAHLLGDIPFVQLVKKDNVLEVKDRKNFVVSADRFFGNLPI